MYCLEVSQGFVVCDNGELCSCQDVVLLEELKRWIIKRLLSLISYPSIIMISLTFLDLQQQRS